MTRVAQFGAGSMAWSRRRILWALSLVFVRPAKANDPIVEMRQFRFVPDEIAVAAGSSVTFVNLDLAPHTATGESFDSGTLRKGERRDIAFPTPGEFQYVCAFHRHMTGRIVVR